MIEIVSTQVYMDHAAVRTHYSIVRGVDLEHYETRTTHDDGTTYIRGHQTLVRQSWLPGVHMTTHYRKINTTLNHVCWPTYVEYCQKHGITATGKFEAFQHWLKKYSLRGGLLDESYELPGTDQRGSR